MRKTIACLAGGLGFGLAAAAANASWAADASLPSTPASVQAPAATSAPALFPGLKPSLFPGLKLSKSHMTDTTLARLDGRGDPTATSVATSVTDQDLTAVNSGNSIVANTVGSGSISLQDNAFSAFNGVGNITMNTGHNNNLQSSISVTVIIGP